VPEAIEAAGELGLRLVPAVEITSIDRGYSDMHVLGYLIDLEEPGLRTLLRGFRQERIDRAARMATALRELGFDLDQSLLDRRAAEGKSIGRPHLSQAVVSHPANASRLQAEGRTELSSFLEAYLIEGKPAFRQRNGPSVAESIAAIHAAGGLAVWAHPFWDVSEPEEALSTIDRFHADGIDGVECFYPTFTHEQTELLADRCDRLGLLSTGSSDFHGPGHRLFSEFFAYKTYGREAQLGAIAA
jgi:predicted metal-dependent phosphoesterase TrpH